MTVQNRPVVGTFDCDTCNEQATVHQTARGKKQLLYVRCGCGCDQRTGKKVQAQWAAKMVPRPGYEHLKPEPEPEPQTTEPDPSTLDKKTGVETTPVSESNPPEPHETAPGAGIMPVIGGLCAVGLFLLTMGGSGTV